MAFHDTADSLLIWWPALERFIVLVHFLRVKFHFLFKNGYYDRVTDIINSLGVWYFSGVPLFLTYESLSGEAKKEEAMIVLPEARLTECSNQRELASQLADML